MTREDVFPANYLQQDDVRAAPILTTIERVTLNPIQDGPVKKNKPVAYFAGDIRPLILNATNWFALESSYGPNSDAWTGHPVEIYHDPSVPNPRSPKAPGGIRLRIPRAAVPAPVTTPKPAPARPAAAAATKPALTLVEKHAMVLAGYRGAQTEAKAKEWAAWASKQGFSEAHHEAQSDVYYEAMDRLAPEQEHADIPY